MRSIRHHKIKDQTKEINQVLRGHYKPIMVSEEIIDLYGKSIDLLRDIGERC